MTTAATSHNEPTGSESSRREHLIAGPGGVPGDKTLYADPVIAVIDGVRTMVFANGEGIVYGLKARTGEELWKVRISKREIGRAHV